MPGVAPSGFPLQEEYKKETGVRAEDVARLRQWLASQPHLPRDHITDLDLVLAYYCCDFSFEVSKQVLDLNYTLRTLFSELFLDRRVDKRVKQSLNSVLTTLLPTRSPKSYACFYVYFTDSNAKNFVFADVVRTAFMIVDLWQFEEGTCPGFVLVFDLEAMNLGHLLNLDLQTVQQLLYFLQEAMFVKVKGLHFVNAPPFMNRILALIKPFTKKKLMDVIQVHPTGSRTLDAYYPIDALPADTETRLRIKENLVKKLESNTVFFAEENKKRVIESKRIGKPKTVTDFFGGVEGSFKKLDID